MKLLISLLLIFTAIAAKAEVKTINVALIFRYEDKFNGTTLFMDKGLELAKQDFEANSKFKINFMRYPHNEKLSSVIEATQKALVDKNFIIIGGENSDEAMAISEIIKDKNIILMTPTSTNPKVTIDRPYVFRACISDDKVADSLAEFVFKDLKAKTVGVLHNVSYPYSDYLSKRFINRFNELIETSQNYGMQRPKLVVQKIVRNQKDFSKEVKYFKEQGVTHQILLSFNSDLLRFFSEATSQSFIPSYIGSDGWGLSENVHKFLMENKTPNDVEAFRNVYWDSTDEGIVNKKFKQSFKKMYGIEANPWAAIAYDAASVIFESVKDVKGELNGESLRVAIKKFKSSNLLTSSRFSFDENNTPSKEVIIYKINKQGIKFYGKR